jgi:hypothetical protein
LWKRRVAPLPQKPSTLLKHYRAMRGDRYLEKETPYKILFGSRVRLPNKTLALFQRKAL